MAMPEDPFYQDPNNPTRWIRSGYTPEQADSIGQQAVQLAPLSSVVVGKRPTPEQMFTRGDIDRGTYERMTGRVDPDTSILSSLFPRAMAAIQDRASYPRQALGAGLDLASGLGRAIYAGAQGANGSDDFQTSLGRVSAPNTSSTASAMTEDLIRDPSNVLIPLTFGAASAVPAVGRGMMAMGRLGQAGLEGLSQAALSGANDYASTGKAPTLGESVARAGLGSALGLGMKLAPSVTGMTGGLFNRTPGTPEGDAFQRWFGGSHVVDDAGSPLTVYHGTSSNFSEFDPKKSGRTYGSDKEGIFFAEDPDIAHNAAIDSKFSAGGNENIMPVNLRVDKPYFPGMTTQQFDESDKGQIYRKAKKIGSDGIRLNDGTWIVFDPTQIKSVFNRGTWDPTDPNIMHIDNQSALTVPAPYDPLAYLKTHVPGTLRSASIQAFGPGNTQGAQQ